MRRFAAAAFAIMLCASPAAAQFGGSPDEQVDGDGAPLEDAYAPDSGHWDPGQAAAADEAEGKQEWVGEDEYADDWPDQSSAGDWPDDAEAHQTAAPDGYGGKDDPAEGYAEAGDAETWEGSDGRTYCRRSDGTTGLFLDAGAGALVGRGFDTRGERGTGTILGAIVGALLGSAVERGASCR